jgi:hypothetical protein
MFEGTDSLFNTEFPQIFLTNSSVDEMHALMDHGHAFDNFRASC